MRKNEEEQGNAGLRTILWVVVGGMEALVLCCLFLLACSVIVSMGYLRESGMPRMVIVCCILGGFLGGGDAVRRIRSRSLFVGLGVGAVFALTLLSVGMLVYGNDVSVGGTLRSVCGSFCGGAAAGVLGVPRQRRRKRGRA